MARFEKWIKDASPERPTAKVAASTLKQRLRAVEKYLQRAADRSRGRVEDVHQLRIWTRRAGAAIDLYRDLLPKDSARAMTKTLKRVRKAANEARDIDVLVERLLPDDTIPNKTKLLKRLRKRRRRAQRPIRKIRQRLIASGQFRRCAKQLRRGLSSKRGKRRFDVWSRERMQPVIAEFLLAGKSDHTDFDRLHAFRIQTKKLRYALELTTAAFSTEIDQELYPKVEALQARLGAVSDRATAQDLFQAWLEVAKPEEARQLEILLERETEELVRAQTQFLEWWTPTRLVELSGAFDRLCDGRPAGTRTSPGSNGLDEHACYGEPDRKESTWKNVLAKDETFK